MKATSFFAIVSFAASVLAGPIIAERQDAESYQAVLSDLLASIQGNNAVINKTLDVTPDNPDAKQQTAAASALAPSIQGNTDAIKAATGRLTSLARRDLLSGHVQVRGIDGAECDQGCLQDTCLGIVWELLCTVKAIILKLGLSCVLAYLSPLILALASLTNCLGLVIDGLLIAVDGLLHVILAVVGGVLLDLL